MLKYTLMLIGSCLVSGALHSQVRYDVRGMYDGGEGKKIYMQVLVGSMDGWTVDSAVVGADGRFVLEGEVTEPMCAMVSSEMDGFQSIFLDGSPLELTIGVVKASKSGEDSTVYMLKEPSLNQLASAEVSDFGAVYFFRNFSKGFMELGKERAKTESERERQDYCQPR